MPIDIFRVDPPGIAVARCFGRLTEEEVLEAIDVAFGTELVPAGTNRIVIADPSADLNALDLPVLERIQKRVLDAEQGDERPPAFNSVLFAPSPAHRPIAYLYKAIWDALFLPGVTFTVAPEVDDALKALGYPGDRVVAGEIFKR